MKVRTYRGTEVSAVIERIKHELGDAAVILGMRELGDAEIEVQALPPQGPIIELEHSLPVGRGIDMGEYIEGILSSQGLDHAVIEKARIAVERLGKKSVRADVVVSEVLSSIIKFDCELPKKKFVALVGATGVGKTTTIAKLAARMQLAFGLRIGLVSTDNYRIGAGFQLQTYASLLTMPCASIEPGAHAAQKLRQALHGFKNFDLVLIDTAGCNPRDAAKINELAELIDDDTSIERMLVLPAPTNEIDLAVAAKAFRPLGYSRILVSKLDESGYVGPAVNVAVASKCPLSFFTTGQRVPEDIEPASARRLGWMLMHTVH